MHRTRMDIYFSIAELVVGLDREFYYSFFSDNEVLVCITVSSADIVCPVEFPFSVIVETADGNAGRVFLHH